ncbi:MAG: hypothetical protein ACFB2Z_11255 [Maricaulaceae bacterium]
MVGFLIGVVIFALMAALAVSLVITSADDEWRNWRRPKCWAIVFAGLTSAVSFGYDVHQMLRSDPVRAALFGVSDQIAREGAQTRDEIKALDDKFEQFVSNFKSNAQANNLPDPTGDPNWRAELRN